MKRTELQFSTRFQAALRIQEKAEAIVARINQRYPLSLQKRINREIDLQ